MLDIGLIGLGPEWESRYRPAILRQGGRVSVRALFTPVSSRSTAVCGELECELAESIADLVERNAVKAVIVLDSAWFSIAPAEFACRAGKPVLLADSLRTEPHSLGSLVNLSHELGTMITPDLVHRHTPSTARLRELLATKLGKPRHLEVAVSLDARTTDAVLRSRFLDDPLAAALDWCHCLAGVSPIRLEPWGKCESRGPFRIKVQFGTRADRSPPPTAAVSVYPAGTAVALSESLPPSPDRVRTVNRERGLDFDPPHLSLTASDSPAASNPEAGADRILPAFLARIDCQHGSATIDGPDRIHWSVRNAQFDELLTAERDSLDVLLDHFARRVVGGLIPLATLEEAVRALAWADAARQAVQSGERLHLDRRTGAAE